MPRQRRWQCNSRLKSGQERERGGGGQEGDLRRGLAQREWRISSPDRIVHPVCVCVREVREREFARAHLPTVAKRREAPCIAAI